MIASGWVVYAAVYAGFAVRDTLAPLLAWFLVYGLYFGLTEGTEKALIADLAPVSRAAFAFGVYNAVLGVGALPPASSSASCGARSVRLPRSASARRCRSSATALLFIVVRR